MHLQALALVALTALTLGAQQPPAGDGRDADRAAIRLEFPRTEIQVYGNTAIIYTTYLYELAAPDGPSQVSTGKATEIFVRRNGAWVNPGWHLTPMK